MSSPRATGSRPWSPLQSHLGSRWTWWRARQRRQGPRTSGTRGTSNSFSTLHAAATRLAPLSSQ
eukprot:14775543-Alexandrium_andersonii.AAC.1